MNSLADCAYWISPDGEIVDVPDRHIHVVINNPAQFGLLLAVINKAYRKCKEPLYSEGKARNEIMTVLIKAGWIRLRFMPKDYSWTVQAHDLKRRTRTNLGTWARFALRNKTVRRDMGVVLTNENGLNILKPKKQMCLGDLVRLPKQSP